MSSAAPLQQATANSHIEARNKPRQLRQNSSTPGNEKRSNFTDSRPQTATQLRLQEAAGNSPHTTQLQALQHLAAASERAAQLKRISAAAGSAALQRVEEEEPLQAKFAALQRVEEDELLQGKFNTAQRVEEDDLLQNKLTTTQRVEDEEPLQGKFAPVQRVEEDELLQGKFDTVQRQEQVTSKPNNTGLPNQLKSGIESLSGMSMDHVKVHYNSSQPAQLNALAYAQGSDIHVAPGQEQHLPHEAWHVVQQAQGRVKPTMQMKDGVPVNDDAGLETEADVMGAKALIQTADHSYNLKSDQSSPFTPVNQSTAHSTQLMSNRRNTRVQMKVESENATERNIKVGDMGMEPYWNVGIGSKRRAVEDTIEEDFDGISSTDKSTLMSYWDQGSYKGAWNKEQFGHWVIDCLRSPTDAETIQRVASANTTYTDTATFTTSFSGTWQAPTAYTTDGKANINFSNPSKVPVGWSDPVIAGSLVNLQHPNQAKGHGVMVSGTVVKLAGASRDQHYSCAVAKHRAQNTNLVHGSGRTWHHLTPNYYMVLMDTRVHGHWSHQGGYTQWT